MSSRSPKSSPPRSRILSVRAPLNRFRTTMVFPALRHRSTDVRLTPAAVARASASAAAFAPSSMRSNTSSADADVGTGADGSVFESVAAAAGVEFRNVARRASALAPNTPNRTSEFAKVPSVGVRNDDPNDFRNDR